MINYLSKYNSSLPRRQANKLNKLLQEKNKKKQFATAQEFRDNLQSLMTELFSEKIKPILSLFEAIEGQEINTETFNFMLDRIEDDLEVAFQEAIDIDETLTSHNQIINDILKSTKHSILDLERKTKNYKIAASTNNSFYKGIYTSFDGTKTVRQKRDINSNLYFLDPKTEEYLNGTHDCPVDQIGKRLELPYTTKSYIKINNAGLVLDSEAKIGNEDITPNGMKMSNMIDSKNGTYWMHYYLFPNKSDGTKTIPSDGVVKTKLKLDLGGIREVNFIELEPALIYPITLDSIIYTNSSGIESTISINQTIKNDRVRVQFSKIPAKYLILVFSNSNNYPVNWEVNYQEDLSIEDVLSSRINQIINPIRNVSRKNFNGYQYQIGFDNIRAGINKYGSKGIFVSQSSDFSNALRVIGMGTEENRPYIVSGSLDTISYSTDSYNTSNSYNFVGSVEYYIVQENYDINNKLISINTYPIAPLNKTRINHERLILTKLVDDYETENVGLLNFYTDSTSGDIKVYRNGTLLTENTDWEVNSDFTVSSPNFGEPMQLAIKILIPGQNDIFTVSYTPILSTIKYADTDSSPTDHQRIIDVLGNGRVIRLEDQSVLLSDNVQSKNIDNSKFRVLVILRRNTNIDSLSPYLETLSVSATDTNQEKFTRF
jgi:hypothetical protein